MPSFIPASLQKRFPILLAVLITGAFCWLSLTRLDLADNSFLTSMEMRWMDAKFRVRGHRPAGNDVVIVGMNDRTLDALGSSRVFQRNHFATLVARLAEAGPKAIGFDIMFQDRDVSDPENDRKFANAIQGAGNVVLGLVLYMEPGMGPRSPAMDFDSERGKIVIEKEVLAAEQTSPGGQMPDKFFNGKNISENLVELTKAAASFGFVNFHADDDGRLRYQPQLIEYGSRLYPSLDLQLLRRYLDAPSVLVHYDANGLIDNVQIGQYNIPTDQFGRLMVDYSGPEGTYQTVEMIDVMEGRVSRDLVKDKIVLVGSSTVGLKDIVTTPYAPQLPGVELHANVIDNILRERYLYRHSGAAGLDFAIIILFGIVLGHFVPKLTAKRAVFYSVLMLVAFAAFNFWTFVQLKWVLSFVYPGLSLMVTSGTLIAWNYFTEEKEKNKTRSRFQNYLDKHVVDQVMNTQPKLGGDKRELTVLFSDIRGFTSFSEKMAPTEVVHFLNQYFNEMSGIIFKYKGTLDKLIGDAVMCFWGAPLEIKDHAVRGVVTALEMIHGVEKLRSVLVLPGGAKFEIGIGLNTGPMVVGNMGSEERFSYTVMGDNVNLGSRLESLNKYYGTKILISDTTWDEVKDMVFCRQLDTIQVKGKSQAVTIYEPLGMKRLEFERRQTDRRSEMTPAKQIKKALVMARYGERRQEERRLGSEELIVKPEQEEIATMYEHALALYRKGDFDAAEMAFDHVLSLKPADGPSRLMKGRIAKYRLEHVDTDVVFDPVYKFDEK